MVCFQIYKSFVKVKVLCQTSGVAILNGLFWATFVLVLEKYVFMPGRTLQRGRNTTFSQLASSPSWDWFSTWYTPPSARPRTPRWVPAWAPASAHACTFFEVQGYTAPLAHPAPQFELCHSTLMDPGRVCRWEKCTKYKIVWDCPIPSWSHSQQGRISPEVLLCNQWWECTSSRTSWTL